MNIYSSAQYQGCKIPAQTVDCLRKGVSSGAPLFNHSQCSRFYEHYAKTICKFHLKMTIMCLPLMHGSTMLLHSTQNIWSQARQVRVILMALCLEQNFELNLSSCATYDEMEIIGWSKKSL